MRREIFRLALPSIVSNITVPLLGIVDLAIVGHMGNETYIGAIAVGTMIFNVIYWLFAFLRMGTSGMTAQALGRGDTAEVSALLYRSLGIGAALGLFFIIVQMPLRWLAIEMMQVQADAVELVCTYFNICILGAPASLCLFSLNGWFVGMQNTRIPMFVAIAQNMINILLSLAFVFGLGMKVEGVALGTTLAQWSAFLFSLFAALRLSAKHYRHAKPELLAIFSKASMTRFFTVNRDIFIRTLCLVAVNMYFTSAGSAQGTMTLAVNSLLMTLFTIFSYFIDGFAFAGEAMSGKAWGEHNGYSIKLNSIKNNLLAIGALLGVCFTLLYYIGGTSFLSLLTNETKVISEASVYLPLVSLVPVCSFLAFVLDGVFIGITKTQQMLISCSIAAFIFFCTYFSFISLMGNKALWLAYILFLVTRGVVLIICYQRIKHK